jgi:pimeloyl-ACP methyl ester carboxylesterase
VREWREATPADVRCDFPMRVIYLHGFASSPSSRKARFFREKFGAMGIPFDAPALDQGDFRSLTVTRQLAIVETLLPTVGALIMGSSLGGYLAALLAERHPEIARLVLLAPAFNLHELWTSQMTDQQLAEWERNGVVPVFHHGAGREVPIGYQFLADAKQYASFPSFSQPSLLFHGVRDNVVPIDLSVHYLTAHPNVRLFRMDSGHELTDVLDLIWQRTEEFLLERPAF